MRRLWRALGSQCCVLAVRSAKAPVCAHARPFDRFKKPNSKVNEYCGEAQLNVLGRWATVRRFCALPLLRQSPAPHSVAWNATAAEVTERVRAAMEDRRSWAAIATPAASDATRARRSSMTYLRRDGAERFASALGRLRRRNDTPLIDERGRPPRRQRRAAHRRTRRNARAQ
jgi:hypothetical protein